MAKRESRAQRWADAVAEARSALEKVTDAKEGVNRALLALAEIQAEYQEWSDNLPENLRDSALGQKLEAVTNLSLDDVEIDTSEVETAIDEADAVELPQGFGRD